MNRYLFIGILIFVGAMVILRILNSLPLWVFIAAPIVLFGVYYYFRKKRKI